MNLAAPQPAIQADRAAALVADVAVARIEREMHDSPGRKSLFSIVDLGPELTSAIALEAGRRIKGAEIYINPALQDGSLPESMLSSWSATHIRNMERPSGEGAILFAVTTEHLDVVGATVKEIKQVSEEALSQVPELWLSRCQDLKDLSSRMRDSVGAFMRGAYAAGLVSGGLPMLSRFVLRLDEEYQRNARIEKALDNALSAFRIPAGAGRFKDFPQRGRIKSAEKWAEDLAELHRKAEDALYLRNDRGAPLDRDVLRARVRELASNPHERVETLRTAWGYARRGMAVAVMPQGKYRTDGLKAHGDGWLSRKRTFQKYFSQDEITELVRSVTGERPVTFAPGILAVFRDKDLEQQVAFRKRSRSLLFPDMALPPRPKRARPAGAEPLAIRAGDELGSIWRTALALGRIPTEEEVDAETRQALQGKGISVGRALAACVREVLNSDLLAQAAAARKEDLLVHFALSLFPGAPRYGSLPASIQRDVRTFFGTHAAVMEAARQELLSLRNPERLEEAFSLASSEGLASFEAGALRFAMERLPRMPVAVRIVTGCAEIVHEGISAADLAEVTTRPVAVTVLACEGFDTALPRVRSSTEVDLARQRTRMRSYKDRVLYLRSRFLERDHPAYAKQHAADARLLSLGIVDEAGRGPQAGDLAALMAGAGRAATHPE